MMKIGQREQIRIMIPGNHFAVLSLELVSRRKHDR